jgi:hypothetical protein
VAAEEVETDDEPYEDEYEDWEDGDDSDDDDKLYPGDWQLLRRWGFLRSGCWAQP